MKDTNIKAIKQADECAHVGDIIETILSEIINMWANPSPKHLEACHVALLYFKSPPRGPPVL